MNLMEGILQERDRLTECKQLIGDETWFSPNLQFYRHRYTQLIHGANEALSGNMETIDIIKLYAEMKDFCI